MKRFLSRFLCIRFAKYRFVPVQESVFGKITKKSNTNLAAVMRLTFDSYVLL